MKRSLYLILAVLLVASSAYAAIEVSSGGTRVGITDKVNFTGPTVSESGGTTTVNATALTTVAVTGDATVGDDLTVTDDLDVDGDLYADAGFNVDGSIYMTGATTGAGLFMKQPDGGCSKCTVDAAGTTFACVDFTCPAGQSEN